MRTGQTKSGISYSPDDGDYQGFLALLRLWVSEAKEGSISDRDIDRFAQHWAMIGRTICLRTKKQWINQLKASISRGRY